MGNQWSMVTTGVPEMSCLMCIVSMFVPICVNAVTRCKVSDKYGLNEHPIMSLLLAYFVIPCSICQVHGEMTMRGEYPGGCCTTQPIMGGAPSPPMPTEMENKTEV